MEKGRKTSLIVAVSIFIVVVAVLITVFSIRKSSNGVYGNSRIKSDTTEVVIIYNGLVVDTPLETTIVLDTVEVYRVIVGSFKEEMNAYGLSYLLTTSEVIIRNGYFMVSKNYHLNLEDAEIERDSLEKGTWVLKDSMIIGK